MYSMMHGCDSSDCSSSTSFKQRSRDFASIDSKTWIFFTATGRPLAICTALCTVEKWPRPIARSTAYARSPSSLSVASRTPRVSLGAPGPFPPVAAMPLGPDRCEGCGHSGLWLEVGAACASRARAGQREDAGVRGVLAADGPHVHARALE